MTKILLSCIRWLQFTGIIASADIERVLVRSSKSRKQFLCTVVNLLLFWHILMSSVVLVPQVVMNATIFYYLSLQNENLQIAYLTFRTSEVIETAQVLFPVMALLGRTLQLVVLAVFRQDISRLLANMQNFVNISNTANVRMIFQSNIFKSESQQKTTIVPFTA